MIDIESKGDEKRHLWKYKEEVLRRVDPPRGKHEAVRENAEDFFWKGRSLRDAVSTIRELLDDKII